jgi:predicted transcriptional regulator of viral defense system
MQVFMNNHFLEILLNWSKSYISGIDLHHILDKSADSRHAIIKRAIQKGYLIPIRRDLYLIKNATRALLNSFEIATIIYGPSYVSFESALSYHGWIPEAVRTTTCASVKRSKEFETPIGIFSYEHIPIKAFSFGVEQHQQDALTLFIASPVKALADIVYARKRTWESIGDLSEDLRIEIENFQNSDRQLLIELIENYPSLRVKKTLNVLLKGLRL